MKAASALKVGILSSSNFITVLVNTVLFPIFPAMSRALELELRDLALLVGIVSFPAAIINLFGGMLSDRLGRKLVIVVSIFFYGLGGLFAGLSILFIANPYPFILLGRFIQGVGSATPMFLTVALVGDIFQSIERTKAAGYLEAANGLGKVSSPIIGALIGLFSWQAIFFMYPIVALPVAVATWIFIKEPQRKVKMDFKKQLNAFSIFKNTSRILTLVAAFLSLFMLIGTMFWLSDFLEAQLQISQLLRGFIISLPAATMMVTTLFAGLISERIHPKIIMSTGILFMSIGTMLLTVTTNTVFFWVVIALIGVGAGVTLPAIDTISTSVKKDEIRGVVATIYGSVRSLGAALAPITFSFLLELGTDIAFSVIAIGGAISAIIIFFLFKEKDILPEDLLPHD